LIASMLEPEAFGRYMATGTQKLTRGHYMFFEVDRGLSSNYFRLHDIEQRCVPHADGSPRRSKYISIYRVLEHIDRGALGKLYLTAADGRTLALDAAPYDPACEKRGDNLYQELCPVSPMVASDRPPAEFAKFLTSPDNALWLPRIMFADLLNDHDEDGNLAGYLPYADPLHIEQCIREVKAKTDKSTKTISRNPRIVAFYRTIRTGFYIGDRSGLTFYPFPRQSELETKHAQWWRSAQLD
jgi:hypothetical protein